MQEYYKKNPRPIHPMFRPPSHTERLVEQNYDMLERIEEAQRESPKEDGFLSLLKEREVVLQKNKKFLQEEKHRLMGVIEATLWKMSENDPALRKEILDNAIKAKVIPPENIVAHQTLDIDILKNGTIKVSSRDTSANVRSVIKQK